MSTPAPQPQSSLERSAQEAPRWSLATRVAFRFCFVYFGLYCLTTQIITSFVTLPEIPDPSTLWPLRQIVTWTAIHVFKVTKELVYFSGSGDKTFDWVLCFCSLVFSALATLIWSVFDRRRKNYVTLHKWFRLFIRFALAGQMFAYGLSKVIPLQMPFPYLSRLIEPFGNFSPMGVLWSSIGASPAYETFAGCAETLAGILLIIPGLATFAALVCLADMTQVFMLNMTYDVPVKLFSFHLILLSLFLLAPDWQRLLNFLALNRRAEPSTQPKLFSTSRANRIAIAVQLLFGIYLLGLNLYGVRSEWHQYGKGAPRSALYGIWNIEKFNVDGKAVAAVINDHERWRRAIFDFPAYVAFERMDDSLDGYGCEIKSKGVNSTDGTLSLSKRNDKNWKATFSYQRSSSNQLTLDGEMNGQKISMRLELLDLEKFLLVSRGFHWVQEYPFNR